jgi:tetratricopeptide (TPR) repeat protein/spermidine synthase
MDSPITEFWINMRNASALMFVPTVLFGMSFPVLTHLVAKGSKDIGSSLGIIYGMNTLGAITGSLIAGYLLLPNLGSQQTLACLSMLNFLAGMLLFATSSLSTGFIRMGAAISLSCLLLLFLLKMPNDLLKEIFLRNTSGKVSPEKLIYLDEGLTTTVAVFNDDSSGVKNKRLILNGVNMSADIMDARKYMTLLSYIPLLLVENAKNVLVICFGTGQTAGAAGAYPGINLVDVVDISPGVFRAGKFFKATNHNVVNNPKVKKIIQDGRQHLLTTSTTYDVITAEPPPPSSAGSVNLYTKEYYELTKRALKPGGIVSQWIPLHSQSETHVYQNFRTFYESFPYVMAWYPVRKELILIGSNQPINLEFQDIKQRLQNPVTNKIMQDIEFDTPYSFLGSIWFLKKELKSLGSGQHVISDNNPSLEFFLDDPRNISEDGISKIIASRSPFEDVWEKITQSSYFPAKTHKVTFKKYWDSRLNADYALLNYDLGTALLAEGKIEKAISHYKMAIKLKPDFAQAHYNLGVALVAEGKNEEAISHYKMAIKLKPDFTTTHYNLGIALVAEGKNEEAISHYKMAIKLKPDFAQAHSNLGTALLAEGKNEEAISHYKMAIKLKPDFTQAHYNLGVALVAEGKNEEAISHYKMAIKLKPDYAQAHSNLGNYLVAEGKHEEAISHHKMAIKLKPSHANAYYNLGNALVAQGKNEEAISHYKMAIKLKPDFAQAHSNLGAALVAEGKNEEAISHYKMAIEINPDYTDAHYNLGAALFQAKMTEEAIGYFKEAIRIRPDFIEAHNNLKVAISKLEKGP